MYGRDGVGGRGRGGHALGAGQGRDLRTDGMYTLCGDLIGLRFVVHGTLCRGTCARGRRRLSASVPGVLTGFFQTCARGEAGVKRRRLHNGQEDGSGDAGRGVRWWCGRVGGVRQKCCCYRLAVGRQRSPTAAQNWGLHFQLDGLAMSATALRRSLSTRLASLVHCPTLTTSGGGRSHRRRLPDRLCHAAASRWPRFFTVLCACSRARGALVWVAARAAASSCRSVVAHAFFLQGPTL